MEELRVACRTFRGAPEPSAGGGLHDAGSLAEVDEAVQDAWLRVSRLGEIDMGGSSGIISLSPREFQSLGVISREQGMKPKLMAGFVPCWVRSYVAYRIQSAPSYVSAPNCPAVSCRWRLSKGPGRSDGLFAEGRRR
jgi:hypothetical protein